MKKLLSIALNSDFLAFAKRCFAELHGEELPENEPYLQVIGEFLTNLRRGGFNRGIVNLPPRHLKTFLCSVCYPAWELGHDPSKKIMIVTYGEALSKEIARMIRKIMRADWYISTFGTCIARDQAVVTDFATTAGGGVFATSFGGGATGRGADLLVIDDPVKISDAENIAAHERAILIFSSELISRLNNRKRGRVLIVAHRLHARDLCGYLEDDGGWQILALPFIASKTVNIAYGSFRWRREKRELLRPEGFTVKEVESILKHKSFEILYQQSPPRALRHTISEDEVPEFTKAIPPRTPIIVSIDPSEKSGIDRSFWVLQAWAVMGEAYVLVDQKREQTGYDGLRPAAMRFIMRHWPSVVLIEDIGVGVALAKHVKRASSFRVESIRLTGQSKAQRLEECLEEILSGRVMTKQGLPARAELLDELLEFPLGEHSDQVDAMTQMLNWHLAQESPLRHPPERVVAVRATPGGTIVDSKVAVFRSLNRF